MNCGPLLPGPGLSPAAPLPLLSTLRQSSMEEGREDEVCLDITVYYHCGGVTDTRPQGRCHRLCFLSLLFLTVGCSHQEHEQSGLAEQCLPRPVPAVKHSAAKLLSWSEVCGCCRTGLVVAPWFCCPTKW